MSPTLLERAACLSAQGAGDRLCHGSRSRPAPAGHGGTAGGFAAGDLPVGHRGARPEGVTCCALLSLKEAEALETEAKLFEDLEFQQLERESRLEEEREARGQQLLQSRAECHRSIARRKVGAEGAAGSGVAGLCPTAPAEPRGSPAASSSPLPAPQERVAALDAQAAQIRLQSAQEAERLARERNGVLQLLQKVMQQSGGQRAPRPSRCSQQGARLRRLLPR